MITPLSGILTPLTFSWTVSSGGGYVPVNAEVVTYKANILAAGSTINDTQLEAIDDWVSAAKSGGWWTSYRLVLPLAGDDYLAAQVPLVATWGTLLGSWFQVGVMSYDPAVGINTGSNNGSWAVEPGISRDTWSSTGIRLEQDMATGTSGFVFGAHAGNQFRINIFKSSVNGGNVNLQNNGNIAWTGAPGFLSFQVESYGQQSGAPLGHVRTNGGSEQTMNQCWDLGPASPWGLYLFGSHANYMPNTKQIDPHNNTTVRFVAIGTYLSHTNNTLHNAIYSAYQTLRTGLGR